MKFIFLFFTLLFSLYTHAVAPAIMTISGHLLDIDNEPYSGALTLRLQLRHPSAIQCVLYERTLTATADTDGKIQFNLGEGTVGALDSGNTLPLVFQNKPVLNGKDASTSASCSINTATAPLKNRNLRVFVTPTGGTEEALTPDLLLNSTPYTLVAEEAYRLDGRPSSDYVLQGASALQIGSANTLGTLFLHNGTSNSVSLKAASGSTTYPLILPSVQGSNGQVLQNDGSGNLSWAAMGGGSPPSSINLNTGTYPDFSGGPNIIYGPSGGNLVLNADSTSNPDKIVRQNNTGKLDTSLFQSPFYVNDLYVNGSQTILNTNNITLGMSSGTNYLTLAGTGPHYIEATSAPIGIHSSQMVKIGGSQGSPILFATNNRVGIHDISPSALLTIKHNGSGAPLFEIKDLGGSPLLTFTQSGNMVVGPYALSGSEKFRVNGGDAVFEQDILPSTDDTTFVGSAAFRFNTVYSTNGVISASDRRLKKDISPTDLGLNFINKLQPSRYLWKTDKLNSPYKHGVIAQELEDVLKEDNLSFAGLLYDKKSDSYNVNYSMFISPLIKAIQELDEKNKKLSQKNQMLEEQLQSLVERIEKLEKR